MDRDSWAAATLGRNGDHLTWSRETPAGAELYGGDRVVVKVHRDGTDLAALQQRLRAARQLPAWFLQPISTIPADAPDGRWATLWPRITVLAPRGPVVPWAEVGALLGELHHSTGERRLGPPLPSTQPLNRLRAALARLARVGHDEADCGLVRGLGQRLVEGHQRKPESPTVVHGDFHPGQVGRADLSRLVLLDVDDLGVGDPAWDLARPAAFYASGVLPSSDWAAFRDGYRSVGGPGLVDHPWAALDNSARTAVVTAAANALAGARPYADGERLALLDTCRAMARSES